MTATEIAQWLEDRMSYVPTRASGEELYSYMKRVARPVAEEQRVALVGALVLFLNKRIEPHTMLAVELAAEFRLIELREEIRLLIDDVRSGKYFFPFYEPIIERELAKMEREM